MKILFLGVGEACDSSYPNTSLLVRAGNGSSVLLDCGFTVPHLYFKHIDSPEELKALWISHFHGDHFFGVPLLLLRFWEMGRKQPLYILGPEGVQQKVRMAMDLAYPAFAEKLSYEIHCVELESQESTDVAGVNWKTARSDHSQNALALRIDDDDNSLFYSGDGRPTNESSDLAEKCDLVIHEAFGIDQATPGHGSLDGSIAFALNAKAKKLALVHISRVDRKSYYNEVQKRVEIHQDLQILLPEPGDLVTL